MIQVGILGLGFMAATHLKALRQVAGARVSALCNPSGRHLDGDFSSIAGNLPGQEPLRWDMTAVKTFRDVRDFLADPDLLLIDICAPTHVHHELVIAALKAGTHVLCEKPLARTSAQGREMVEAARQAGKILMPAMCLRFLPSWVYLQQAIQSGRFGKVLGVHFRRVAQPPGWGQGNFLDGQKSGGALLDLHIHDADFVQFCFGRPQSVFSTGFSRVSGAVDHVMTQYEVDGGACVTAEGGWAMNPGFGFNMSYTAVFERATLDYDLSRGDAALKLFANGAEPEIILCPGADGYVGEIQHIVDCIRENRLPDRVTAQDGIAALELCEAEEKSVRTRQIVSLD